MKKGVSWQAVAYAAFLARRGREKREAKQKRKHAMDYRNQILIGDNLDVMRKMPTGFFNLTLTSPPYEDARTYSIGFKLAGQAWVDWMIERVVEMCRVTAGLVFINAAGKTRDWKYSPVMEWLVADLTRKHGIVCGPAPYVFYRIGIPGSGQAKYHRRDWEPIYAFALPENVPPTGTDNTCMGCAPAWEPGGKMSNRTKNGERRRSPGEKDSQTRRKPDGERARDGEYTEPMIANPGNVIQEKYTAEQVNELMEQRGDVVKCLVGGGVMGDKMAHENEAPFPETLVEFFIRSYCPEGGVVLDPFSGSGTVAKIAQRWGRSYCGIDIRESQVKLGKKRVHEKGTPLFT